MREIEVKLQLKRPHKWKLALHYIEDNYQVLNKKNWHLQAIYYDTIDFAFKDRAKAIYRHRIENGKWVATIKTGNHREGNISSREEHNFNITPKSEPVICLPEGELKTRLLVALNDGNLYPLIETNVRRYAVKIRYKQTEIEVAFDKGYVSVGAEKDYFMEIEFELLSGEKEELVEFVEEFSIHNEVQASTYSKYTRGLRLLRLSKEQGQNGAEDGKTGR